MRVSARYFLFLIAATSFAGCEPSLSTDDVPAVTAGSIDLRRYISIGDDFTAGVVNGGLTRASQEYSFPNQLAKQFQLAGGGAFTQPLLSEGVSTRTVQLQGLTDRNLPLLGAATVSFVDSIRLNAGSPCSELRYQFERSSTAGTVPNNLGIPRLRLTQVSTTGLGNEANQAGSSDYNAYFERLLPNGSDQTYLQTIRAAQPSFLTVSMGLSDLLPYVLSGGTCGSLPSASSLGLASRQLIDSLSAATTAKGVILSVPTLANLPLTRTQVSAINRRLGRPDTTSMYVLSGSTVKRTAFNDVVLLTMIGRIGRNETATGQPASAPFGLDATNPLRDQDVLSGAEITNITGRINGRGGINEELAKKATNSGGRFIFIDLKNFYLTVATGLYANGVRYSDDTVIGGMFNYDGYTLSPRGNALLANAILEQMANTDPKVGFGLSVPRIDINSLPATPLP
jgi:hypothetical protein